MSVAESPYRIPESRESLPKRILGATRYGLATLADHFTRAKEAALRYPRQVTTRAMVLTLAAGGALALTTLIDPRAHSTASRAETSETSTVAETLVRQSTLRQLNVYERAIDDSFRGKLVPTRSKDMGLLDVATFTAARQLDTHNPPNPNWTYAYSFPGQEDQVSADLTTTLYFNSAKPKQEGIHDIESLERAVTRGDISPLIGRPASNEAMIAGLRSVLGDAGLYEIGIGNVGPSREQTTAAIGKLVTDGKVLGRASLDQAGILTVDTSRHKQAQSQTP